MAQLLVFGTYQTYHKSSGGRMDFSSLPRSWQVAVVRWCRNPSNHTDKGRATIGNSVDGSREKFGPNPSKSLEEKSIPKKIQQDLLYCCTKWIQNEPKKKMAKRPDWYCRCCQCSPVFVEIIIQPVLYAQVGSHLACKNYGCPYFKSHPVPTWFCIPRSSMIFQEKPWPDLIFFSPTAPRDWDWKNHHENRPGGWHHNFHRDAGTTMFGCDWGTLQTISSQGASGGDVLLQNVSKAFSWWKKNPGFESFFETQGLTFRNARAWRSSTLSSVYQTRRLADSFGVRSKGLIGRETRLG